MVVATAAGGDEEATMVEEDEWRAAAGSSSQHSNHQSMPLFAQLLTSFPTPPHDSLLFANAHMEEGSASIAQHLPPPPPPPRPLPPTPLPAAAAAATVEMHQPAAAAATGSAAATEEEKTKVNSSNSTKKVRSKNWTRLEMLRLIRLRSAFEPRFASGGKKVELWDDIAESLRREGIPRDGQQCRDKWEKLSAAYKEVRDGSKLREDFPLFDDLHPILSARSPSRRTQQQQQQHQDSGDGVPGDGYDDNEDDDDYDDVGHGDDGEDVLLETSDGGDVVDGGASALQQQQRPRKKRRCLPVTDLGLVESILARQQRFFKELLESMERREQAREQRRQEREERWRSEDKAQNLAFNNAMIALVNRLFNSGDSARQQPRPQQLQQAQAQQMQQSGGPKKRSKNWKRVEVLQLIRLRGQMESQFASGTRRSALWDELAETLMKQGIPRDGKQCREKWDKLMAGLKDVTDGVKEATNMPYFNELSAALQHRPPPTPNSNPSSTPTAIASTNQVDPAALPLYSNDELVSGCVPRSPRMS